MHAINVFLHNVEESLLFRFTMGPIALESAHLMIMSVGIVRLACGVHPKKIPRKKSKTRVCMGS
jgi:hypothetical protein